MGLAGRKGTRLELLRVYCSALVRNYARTGKEGGEYGSSITRASVLSGLALFFFSSPPSLGTLPTAYLLPGGDRTSPLSLNARL